MENNLDTNIIPGASYHVYEYSPTKSSSIARPPGQVSKKSKTITFYTFDGNPITTREHNFEFEKMNSMLDSFALCPKPFSYKRVWMPAFKIVSESLIVEAGYMVIFHDKNGCRFLWEVLNNAQEDISTWEEYDLSETIEEESDFSLKDVDMDLIYDQEDNNQEEQTSNFSLTDTQVNFSRKTKIEFGLSGISFDLSKSNMSLSRMNNTMTLSRINFAVNEMEALIKEKAEEEKVEEKAEEEKIEEKTEEEKIKEKAEEEKAEEKVEEEEKVEGSCVIL